MAKPRSHKNNLARLTAPERALQIVREMFHWPEDASTREIKKDHRRDLRILVRHLELHADATLDRAARRKAK